MKDKSKKKKEKKNKKEKSTKKRKVDETKLDDTAASSADQEVVVTVSLDVNIASLSGCSWGSVFAAASQITPAEGAEDENFWKRNESTLVDPGLVKMSEIAASILPKVDTCLQKSDKSSPETLYLKRKRTDSHDDSLNEEPTLEGRMVPHPDTDEQFMVLVDSRQNIVYSALKRTPNGDGLRLGILDKGNICWDEDAFSEDKTEDGVSDPDSFPFPTDQDDHCESPLESYRDILPFLELLCHGNKDELKIYDPYYCDGAVKRNFRELGFTRVHNEKQDAYRVWANNLQPEYQVLVTNPPYSDQHIPKLFQFITSQKFGDSPWFLLLPNWVHKKDYYKSATNEIQPFYLVPKKRYVYLPPKRFRDKKASDVHKKSSPFPSMWYIWGGSNKKNDELIQRYLATKDPSCELCRSRSALRDLRRKGQKQNKK